MGCLSNGKYQRASATDRNIRIRAGRHLGSFEAGQFETAASELRRWEGWRLGWIAGSADGFDRFASVLGATWSGLACSGRFWFWQHSGAVNAAVLLLRLVLSWATAMRYGQPEVRKEVRDETKGMHDRNIVRWIRYQARLRRNKQGKKLKGPKWPTRDAPHFPNLWQCWTLGIDLPLPLQQPQQCSTACKYRYMCTATFWAVLGCPGLSWAVLSSRSSVQTPYLPPSY
ncbi:hypothetical protein CCMA1212_000688 [Trichoderma ghanense]|uniref:Uncharacterized protein n=1 Tax=Trichoderma ghanense TaxID=65468 RepID=A0ABY2HH51_9HYPO